VYEPERFESQKVIKDKFTLKFRWFSNLGSSDALQSIYRTRRPDIVIERASSSVVTTRVVGPAALLQDYLSKQSLHV